MDDTEKKVLLKAILLVIPISLLFIALAIILSGIDPFPILDIGGIKIPFYVGDIIVALFFLLTYYYSSLKGDRDDKKMIQEDINSLRAEREKDFFFIDLSKNLKNKDKENPIYFIFIPKMDYMDIIDYFPNHRREKYPHYQIESIIEGKNGLVINIVFLKSDKEGITPLSLRTAYQIPSYVDNYQAILSLVKKYYPKKIRCETDPNVIFNPKA